MSDVQLDRWQSEALEACRAPCRVSLLGAPGTGKSAVVAALVLRYAFLAAMEEDLAQISVLKAIGAPPRGGNAPNVVVPARASP